MGPPMRNCASEISARDARLSGTTRGRKCQPASLRTKRSNPFFLCFTRLDCFVARAPRNDVEGAVLARARFKMSNSRHTSAFSRHHAPEACVSLSLQGGSRECRMHAAPAVPCAKETRKSHTSIQGSGGDLTFPAQWLYDLYRAHPGVSGFPAPVASRKLALRPGRAFAPPRDLTPTIEASGPHDFAVRFGTARRHVLKTAHGVYPALQSHRAHDAAASTASHPNVR